MDFVTLYFVYLLTATGAAPSGYLPPLEVRNPPCGIAGNAIGVQFEPGGFVNNVPANPRAVLWPDPYFPGDHCRVDITQQVAALQPGTYEFATTEMGKVGGGPYIGIDPHTSATWVKVAGEPPPLPPATCTTGGAHAITIRVEDWTRSVAIGARGKVLLTLANSFPIVLLQVKLNSQVIGEVNGADLRDLAGLYFSVPRTPGSYNITVAATDATACQESTTAIRTVIVQ